MLLNGPEPSPATAQWGGVAVSCLGPLVFARYGNPNDLAPQKLIQLAP